MSEHWDPDAGAFGADWALFDGEEFRSPTPEAWTPYISSEEGQELGFLAEALGVSLAEFENEPPRFILEELRHRYRANLDFDPPESYERPQDGF